jgi:hypothetical protein
MIAGRIAATLGEPLFSLLERPWDEVLRWWPIAADIHAETFGLLQVALLRIGLQPRH